MPLLFNAASLSPSDADTARRHRVQFAAVGLFALIAFGGTALVGCGSGSGTLPVVPNNTGSGGNNGGNNNGSLVGRTFRAGNLTLGTGRAAALSVQIAATGQATGSLTVATGSASGSIPLTGTGNPSTGAFDVSGSGSVGGQALSVTARGAVPTGGATTGGTVVVGVNGQSFPTTGFNNQSTTTPGATPTPTPSGSPTPTPTPTATASPNPGQGTLGQYLFTQSATGTLTYRDTTTVNSANPITGQPTTETTTSTYTTQGGEDPFSGGQAGQRTQANLNGVTVTRQEILDDENRVSGYTYFTLDNNAYTLYGSDDVDPGNNGRLQSRTRYSPAVRFSLDLRVGQTATSSTTATLTDFDDDPETPETETTRTFDQTFTLRFLAIESATVPAGTFSDTARVQFDFSFNAPAQGDVPAFTFTGSSTGNYARNVGEVRSNSDFRSVFTLPGQTQPFETRTQTLTELISRTNQ